MSRKNARSINTIPFGIELFILVFIAFLKPDTVLANANVIACSLLFAMGLQNALVTSISNSEVRTTHLTGLFTDWELSFRNYSFSKNKNSKKSSGHPSGCALPLFAFSF